MANRTNTTAMTSPPNHQESGESDEYKRDIFWEIGSALIGATFGALHALSANEGHASNWTVTQIIAEIFIFGGLGWLIKQADYLRRSFHRFRTENEGDRERIINTEVDTRKELRRLCNRAEKAIEIKEGIYGTIGNAFSHSNEMVRRFLMGSIGEALQPLQIGADRLEARSDTFTRSLYSNFWDELVAEQARRGKKDPLQVYVSHASSIAVFEDDGRQSDLLGRQGDFRAAGGVIRRVLIRNPGLEAEDRYEDVKKRMENIGGAEVKILDLEKVAKTTDDLLQDFLLVQIDGQPYVLEWVWILSRREPQFGSVSATNIYLTSERCRPFYRSWRNILQSLKERKPGEDLSDWHI